MKAPVTYKMVGTDGVEYGPVTLKEIQSWAKQGRLTGASLVQRSNAEGWSTASAFPELGIRDSIGGAEIDGELDAAESADLEKKVLNGGSWFYWIAGLSFITSVVVLCGANWAFFLGLTTTQLIDVVLRTVAEHTLGSVVKAVALVIDFTIAALFVTLGVFSRRRQTWAFIVGLIVYGCDTVLTVVCQVWGALFWHGWAMFSLWIGLKAAIRWNKLARVARANQSPTPAPVSDSQLAA